VATPTLRPSTLVNHRWALDRQVIPRLGRVKLAQLSPAHVRQLMSEIQAEGLSGRSAQLCRAVLRSMLSEAVRDQIVQRNVAALVRGPRVDHSEVVPWSPEEAGAFLTSMREHRLYSLFAVGVAVGLRRGELLGLRWSDVDFDEGTIRVQNTVQRLGKDPSGW